MSALIFSNLAWASLVVFGAIFSLWLLHFRLKDASIIDLFWAAGFALIAWSLYTVNYGLSFEIRGSVGSTQLALLILPTLWAIRYTFFIFQRNFGKGEDDRYTALRKSAASSGQSWWVFSLVKIYFFQGFSMLLVALPIIIGLAAPSALPLGILGILGLSIWALGFILEATADWQLERFKAKHKNYVGPYAKKPLLTTGIWRYSRHPNYFGNACMWWGIGLVALAAPSGWLGLIGPLYMHLMLVYVTGKANNESKMKARKAYADYVEKTSGFVPWWPKK